MYANNTLPLSRDYIQHFLLAVAYRGGGFKPPPTPEIPKALQNRAKVNPIVKTVKNCWI